jgi:transaldolase
MTEKSPHIVSLNNLGQSVWYDNLSRDVLRSGELASLIQTGVSGLTSNPTIFKQAIADSDNYDEAMKASELQSLDTENLCEELMIQDVAAAADLLKPIYDATDGADGYASIEVSPNLSNDEVGTVAAAERLWAKLDRPNIMIKIPATPACIPAIQKTLEKGINVNVTLIFSKEVYEAVAEAYLKALEARKERGEDISRIASVASFFISRVDASVEKSLDALIAGGTVNENTKDKFLGKVGIANSKVAYEAYEGLFLGQRFAPLKESGGRVQRPLWASTGTKNPSFSPVLYVEELAGRDTVNTMPPATLKALLAEANITDALHTDLAEAKELLSELGRIGVSFEAILDELQKAGVESFVQSYKDLLASIEIKRGKI